MHNLKSFILILFCGLCLASCSTVERVSEEQSIMFDLSVKIAANRVIKNDVNRADRLITAATNLKSIASQDESTVEAIRSAIYDYIAKEDFSPDERLLLNEFSIIIARELENRVDENLVSAEYSVLISRIADLVIESAEFFKQSRTEV